MSEIVDLQAELPTLSPLEQAIVECYKHVAHVTHVLVAGHGMNGLVVDESESGKEEAVVTIRMGTDLTLATVRQTVGAQCATIEANAEAATILAGDPDVQRPDDLAATLGSLASYTP